LYTRQRTTCARSSCHNKILAYHTHTDVLYFIIYKYHFSQHRILKMKSKPTEIGHLQSQLTELKSNFRECFNRIIGCELQLFQNSKISSNQPDIEIPQDSTRTNKIVIIGLSFSPRTSPEEEVGSFLDRRLNIHPKLVKVTLLRKNPLISKCPALVTLYSRVDKALIFRNCHKLKFSSERV
jgi:hypothetical protein